MKIIIALLISTLTTACYGQGLLGWTLGAVQEAKDDRIVEIIGQVDGDIINQAAEVERLSNLNNEPIELLINSPGGSVFTGMIFIDAMNAAKAKGIKFKCTSVVLAASMAYTIFSNCDERYAQANTRLLFHPMSTRAQGRVQELVTDLIQTVPEEKAIMDKLRNDLGIDWKTFHTNYFAETFWTATTLLNISPEFLTIVDDVGNYGANTYKYKRGGFFEASGIAQDILNRFEGVQ